MPSDKLLSCRIVETNPVDTTIRIYQNGGSAGLITIETRVTDAVMERLEGTWQSAGATAVAVEAYRRLIHLSPVAMPNVEQFRDLLERAGHDRRRAEGESNDD